MSEIRFNALAGYARSPWTWIASNELAWYSEANEKVLAVLVQDTTDGDYSCVVMGRDRVGRYRAIHLSSFVATIGKARSQASELLPEFAAKDPAEFEQGDEPQTAIDFFAPVHGPERQDVSFRELITKQEFSPAKGIMEAMMYYFRDPDGNFVEQFQSSAFNARLWELYLFALLAERRFNINRDFPAPDYNCLGVGGKFFIEAVTANPTLQGGVNIETGKPESEAELRRYMDNYLPLKFSGPLTAKLQRRYWEQPHIGDQPIVFAIADFHFPGSQEWSQSALCTYLYGLAADAKHDTSGHLQITWRTVPEHVWGTKRVPSGFFNLPNAEHISAVISTREADIWKFNRMGLKAGFGSPGIKMKRTGKRYDPDPNASEPVWFSVDVHSPDYVEEWTDGLEIYHNPHARFPLDTDAFPGAVHHRLAGGRIVSYTNQASMFGTRTSFVA